MAILITLKPEQLDDCYVFVEFDKNFKLRLSSVLLFMSLEAANKASKGVFNIVPASVIFRDKSSVIIKRVSDVECVVVDYFM